MKNIYLLDTSVLIHNPHCIEQYKDCNVCLPIAVLDELDDLKKRPGEVGRNARVFIRYLDQLTKLGDLSEGVITDRNVLISVDANAYPPKGNNPSYGDNAILACACGIQQSLTGKDELTLVSNDVGLRVRAAALGLEVVSLESKERSVNELYTGIQEIKNEKLVGKLTGAGSFDASELKMDTFPNQCFVLKDKTDKAVLGRRVGDKIRLVKKQYPWDLKARNEEQALAMELISDPSIHLVSLVGISGSGKTLVALASALELVMHQGIYDKLVIYRPIQVVGNDIGYVPGSVEEKLMVHYSAILDNLEVLFTLQNGDKWKNNLENAKRKETIQFDPITYIRGRSIPNALILLDECQNISREEIKTVLTRTGEGSKVILTGDILQIDNPRLDAIDNGLTYVVEKFKGNPLFGHLAFSKGERSKLATAAAELL
jgi:PhoH-like ATPase